MKEPYMKPMFGVELFSLTQTMAGACTTDIPKDDLTLNEISACAWNMGGGALMYINEGVCNFINPNTQVSCYNNLTGDATVFRS